VAARVFFEDVAMQRCAAPASNQSISQSRFRLSIYYSISGFGGTIHVVTSIGLLTQYYYYRVN